MGWSSYLWSLTLVLTTRHQNGNAGADKAHGGGGGEIKAISIVKTVTQFSLAGLAEMVYVLKERLSEQWGKFSQCPLDQCPFATEPCRTWTVNHSRLRNEFLSCMLCWTQSHGLPHHLTVQSSACLLGRKPPWVQWGLCSKSQARFTFGSCVKRLPHVWMRASPDLWSLSLFCYTNCHYHIGNKEDKNSKWALWLTSLLWKGVFSCGM